MLKSGEMRCWITIMKTFTVTIEKIKSLSQSIFEKVGLSVEDASVILGNLDAYRRRVDAMIDEINVNTYYRIIV